MEVFFFMDELWGIKRNKKLVGARLGFLLIDRV